MKTELISLDKLKYAREAPPELNLQVRKSRDDVATSDDELRASLKLHGLMRPLLIVTHEQKLFVVAGNRRLRLMRELGVKKGEVANAVDFGDPREVALAENLGLPPHPIDRYEIIAGMVGNDGMTAEDAKQRFGMSDRSFAQIMRLGSMSPLVREAWRDGAIDGETARAFTLTDDQKLQEKHLKRMSENGQRPNYHMVRHAIVGSQSDVGRHVVFVGFDACDENKVGLKRDLFGSTHTVSDQKKLMKLVDEKLAAAAASMVADHGWSWAQRRDSVASTWEYGDLPVPKRKPTKEERARVDAIAKVLGSRPDDEPFSAEEQKLRDEYAGIEAVVMSRSYAPEDRAKAGCFLSVASDGALKVELGKLRPREKAKIKSDAKKTAAPKREEGEPGEVTLSNSLAFRLSESLQEAIAETIKTQPVAACAALIAGFGSGGGVVNVRVGNGSMPSGSDFVSFLGGALKVDEPRLMSMLAQIAAEAIDVRTLDARKMPLDRPDVAALCACLPPAVLNAALLASFDREDYFSSVSRDAIVDAVREMMTSEHAAQVAKMPKKSAVEFALMHVTTCWLPAALRTAGYDGPSAAAKPKTQKAAPASKPAKKAIKKTAKKKSRK